MITFIIICFVLMLVDTYFLLNQRNYDFLTRGILALMSDAWYVLWGLMACSVLYLIVAG